MVILLMGPAGSGKTTIGNLLHRALGWEFADADTFHSSENIDKMRSGIPLTDADRQPWLDSLRGKIEEWLATGSNGIIACSALKESYRSFLLVSPEIHLVYLKASPDLLSVRLRERGAHYMKENMLASQLAILEEPKHAIVVDVGRGSEFAAQKILRALPQP